MTQTLYKLMNMVKAYSIYYTYGNIIKLSIIIINLINLLLIFSFMDSELKFIFISLELLTMLFSIISLWKNKFNDIFITNGALMLLVITRSIIVIIHLFSSDVEITPMIILISLLTIISSIILLVISVNSVSNNTNIPVDTILYNLLSLYNIDIIDDRAIFNKVKQIKNPSMNLVESNTIKIFMDIILKLLSSKYIQYDNMDFRFKKVLIDTDYGFNKNIKTIDNVLKDRDDDITGYELLDMRWIELLFDIEMELNKLTLDVNSDKVNKQVEEMINGLVDEYRKVYSDNKRVETDSVNEIADNLRRIKIINFYKKLDDKHGING